MIKTRQQILAQGTTKTLYKAEEDNRAILSFQDQQRVKSAKEISGKGILNNRISAHLMTELEAIGLPTHFIRSLNMREQEVKLLLPINFVVRIRNVASGSIIDRIGLEEGTILPRPILEFYHKKESGNYTLISEDHIMAFQWADPMEMEEIITIAYRANDFLNGLLTALNIRLVDFQLEIGRLWGGFGELYLMIADELSPDTMRLWDRKTNKPFDLNTIHAYQDIATRLNLIPSDSFNKDEVFNENMIEDLDHIENILANDKSRKIRSIKSVPNRKIPPRA